MNALADGGGGGGGLHLDTELDGSPSSIRAVADWLRKSFGDDAEELATSVWRQKSRAASDWSGQTADAFASRTKNLASATDGFKQKLGLVANIPDDLATALEKAVADLATVRSNARAGDLTVSGYLVHHPGSGPPEAGPSPADGAPQAEMDAWQAADQAVIDHNAKVVVWNKANKDAAQAFEDWGTALEESASAWTRWDKELSGLTSDLLTAGVEIALIRKVVPILLGESEALKQRAIRLREHANAMKNADGVIPEGSRGRFYDFLDRADDLDNRAAGVRSGAIKAPIPKGLGGALGALGIFATGYAIHEDMEEGESLAQASVSNGVGFAASVGTGMYVGGVVGSFIPVPVVGTVAGVVVGAAVGTVVGAFTSGAIDSLWDNGLSGLDDAGQALSEGWGEVESLGESVGDVASDAWNSIF